jgi:hypothetical protein
MLSTGQAGPQTIPLGGKKMFAVDELREWVRAGCPNREQWKKVKDAENGH